MVSRRDFLRKSTLTAFSWSVFCANFSSQQSSPTFTESGSDILGRVLFEGTPTFTKPDVRSTSNGTYDFNDVLALSQPITGYSQSSKNDIWFGMEKDTYIQSQYIQLVHTNLNEPRDDISTTGQLAEITVPFSEAWPGDQQNTHPHQIFFYGSTHWVHGLGKDLDNNLY